MDHQGTGRTRSAADTRRQAPWPWPESAERPSDATAPFDAVGFAEPESTGHFTDPGGPAEAPAFGTGFWAGAPAGSGSGPAPGYGQEPVYGQAPGTARGSSGAYPAQGTGASHSAEPGSGAQPVPGSGSGAQRVLGYGSGAQRVLGPGTGPQRLIGSASGPQAVLRGGSGAQPVLGGLSSLGSTARTPVRGFPPGREPSEPPQGGFSAWHAPREPLTGEDDHAPDDGYGYGGDTNPADATNPMARLESQTRLTPAGGRRSAKAKPKRRLLSRTVLLAATAAVVVAAAGFAGYKFLYVPRVNAPVSSSLRLPTTAPGPRQSDPALGKWQHIGTRAEDPEPLTIAELYPPQFILNDSSYVRTAASVTKTCSLAVYGANLQAALQTGHCSQVVRASYISGNGQMMGTIGVVNLSTATAAQKAGKVAGPQEIIAPLAARKGATKKLGNGTGVEQAEIKGHYLILMWAEFANLKSPSTSAARQQLETFANDLLTGSANINLSSRLLNKS